MVDWFSTDFKEYQPERYLVNNGKCKIPDLKDVLSIVADSTQNETKCTEKVPHLTYVMNGVSVLCSQESNIFYCAQILD